MPLRPLLLKPAGSRGGFPVSLSVEWSGFSGSSSFHCRPAWLARPVQIHGHRGPISNSRIWNLEAKVKGNTLLWFDRKTKQNPTNQHQQQNPDSVVQMEAFSRGSQPGFPMQIKCASRLCCLKGSLGHGGLGRSGLGLAESLLLTEPALLPTCGPLSTF